MQALKFGSTSFGNLQAIEIYLLGTGSVGGALIAQIQNQQAELLNQGIKIKICAIANSKNYLYETDGIDLNEWQDNLKTSTKTDILSDLSKIKPTNGAIVDCTSSSIIAENYSNFFKSGFHIVAANKKANSSNYTYFQQIRQDAHNYQRNFLYETNVGAGLPIIDNFKSLIKTGDRLIEFSGIMSGSLSFIFGSLEEGLSFSDAVKAAHSKKFTEPDPREDLSGLDVARKLLIIARETGLASELDDIIIEPILPLSFDSLGTTEEFLTNLSKIDEYYQRKVNELAKDGKVLRFVAEIKNNICRAGVREVAADNPLYHVKNGENAFVFLTKRYNPIPLVVRGYGAGVEVTAAGIFADILKIAQNINKTMDPSNEKN